MTIDLSGPGGAPPPKARYVKTEAIKAAAAGREAEIVRALGIPWQGRHHIRCPYPDHYDHDPSWRITEQGLAICTCREGQAHSVIDVAMHLEGVDFEDAKIRVAELLGREDLIIDPNARGGITLDEYAVAKGLNLEFLIGKCGLRDAVWGKKPAIRMPYMRSNDPKDKPEVKFRIALAGDKKTMWAPKSKALLYGAHWAGEFKNVGHAIIVEGESDCHTLWQHGFPAIGLPGAGNWNEGRDAPLLEGVPVIYVIVEPDRGGTTVLSWLARSSIAERARLVHMPAATKDPSALYLSNPTGFVAAFQRLLDAAGPISQKVLEEPPPEEFIRDQKGVIIASSQDNIRIALNRLGFELAYNSFSDRMLIRHKGIEKSLDDGIVKIIRFEIDSEFNFRPSKEFFEDIVEVFARKNYFHPVREYLNSLKWDGEKRISRWLIDYAGAEDSSYVCAVSKLVLIAAVRRVRQPGCKFDEMMVLESDEGRDKSSALKIMAVRQEWFTDDLPLASVDPRRIIECTRGRWIVESADLKGIRSSEVEHLKAMMSRTEDSARLAYGHFPTEVLREFVIFGTTNEDRYLRSSTGNRRFWPVRVTQFKLPELTAIRDQLWAEAAHEEARGVSIRLDPELYPDAGEAQEQRRIEDPWIGVISDSLKNMKGKIKASDIWVIIDMPPERRTQAHNERLGSAMRELGWTRVKRRFGGLNPENSYANVPSTDPQAENTLNASRDPEGRLTVWESVRPIVRGMP